MIRSPVQFRPLAPLAEESRYEDGGASLRSYLRVDHGLTQIPVHVEEVDDVDQRLTGYERAWCGYGKNSSPLPGAFQGEVSDKSVDLSAASLEDDKRPQSFVIAHFEGDFHGFPSCFGRACDLEFRDKGCLGITLVEGLVKKAADGGHPGMSRGKTDGASGSGLMIEHLSEVVVSAHHDVPGIPGVMEHAEDVAQFVDENAVAGLGFPVAGAFVLSSDPAHRGLVHEVADLLLDGGSGDFVSENVA